MRGIAVGIVLFNPDDEERLIQGLDSISKQTERIFVFDNSTKRHNIAFPSQVVYLSEKENKGIAYALNRIMEQAEKDGYEWLVTMDQDSIIPENYICEISKIIDRNNNVAIICPQVVDSRRSYMTIKKEPEWEYIDFCITSASCTRISSWKKVGKFDEWLFIDLVDNDFCKRVVLSDYKILRLNSMVLDQEFGTIIPKSAKIQTFWNFVAKILHNQNFAKFGYNKNVNPMRVYYTCRNVLYLNKKFKNNGCIGYKDNYNCNSFVGFVFAFVCPSILRSDKKVLTMKEALKGFYEGIHIKVIPWKREIDI